MDCMVALFGNRTVMPLEVGATSVRGTVEWMRVVGSCVKKWAVAPVSASMSEFVVGGRLFCGFYVCA